MDYQNSVQERGNRYPFSNQKPIWLNNSSTAKDFYDTLHHKGPKNVICEPKACKGSFMSGLSPRRPRGVPRPKTEVWQMAQEFLKEYYNECTEEPQIILRSRLEMVRTEIDRRGTYELTKDELVYGAKVAWRNASRCIARIHWKGLEVKDCRHVRTSKEMAEALFEHIEWANNNGNLRSCITIFPQRIPDKDDFQVWNAQLFMYAGYSQPDGSVIGDGGRTRFTQLCEHLGWKGKGGRFDILPLVLKAPQEKFPQFYEIPEDHVLEVPMSHPKYPWFEKLGLKWYALPAVADMMLDVGGVEFPAAPFNGWYTGSEIGSRNFCDPHRYYILEEVAKKMGLDVSSNDTLWKDRAVVQINAAVLHSFQKHGVTISDHHSVAESFMKFMEQEQDLRGGCNGDWVWLVPPLSGNIVPTYHQDILNYNLKPSFEYQDKPWEKYLEKIEASKARQNGRDKSSINK